MKNIKKILIIRLGAIGDAVFTTIIPYAVKQAYPECEIHYLVPCGISAVLEDNKYIDKIYNWDNSQKKSFKYFLSVAKELFSQRYDVVFNFNNTSRCFLLSALCFAKKVVQKRKYGKSWVEDFFLSAKKVFPNLTKPDRLYLEVNKDIDNSISEYLKDFPKPHVVFVPGGETNKNRAGRVWNIENWKILSDKILNNFGGTIFICGGASEKETHLKLQKENVIILSGEHNLKQTSSLLSRADLVISGDTGPLHIASAHNVKTLALLGSTSPDKIKPYGENGYWVSSDYPCKYCWKKKCKKNTTEKPYTPCMEALSADKVYQAIIDNNLL